MNSKYRVKNEAGNRVVIWTIRTTNQNMRGSGFISGLTPRTSATRAFGVCARSWRQKTAVRTPLEACVLRTSATQAMCISHGYHFFRGGKPIVCCAINVIEQPQRKPNCARFLPACAIYEYVAVRRLRLPVLLTGYKRRHPLSGHFHRYLHKSPMHIALARLSLLGARS